MMAYSGSIDQKRKHFNKKVLIPGVSGASLEGFRGTLENRRRVGCVGLASLARGGSRSDRRAGIPPYVASFYDNFYGR